LVATLYIDKKIEENVKLMMKTATKGANGELISLAKKLHLVIIPNNMNVFPIETMNFPRVTIRVSILSVSAKSAMFFNTIINELIADVQKFSQLKAT
jgi:hypothetical protein